MRHRRGGYKLGRTTAHRAATLRNLAMGLFQHGQIVTTVPKAKALQPMVEKIVTLAKRGDLHARRLVVAKLGGDRYAFDWLYLARTTDEEKEAVGKLRDRAKFFPLPDGSRSAHPLRRTSGSPENRRHLRGIAPGLRIARAVAPSPVGRHRIVTRQLCVIQFVGGRTVRDRWQPSTAAERPIACGLRRQSRKSAASNAAEFSVPHPEQRVFSGVEASIRKVAGYRCSILPPQPSNTPPWAAPEF